MEIHPKTSMIPGNHVFFNHTMQPGLAEVESFKPWILRYLEGRSEYTWSILPLVLVPREIVDIEPPQSWS